MSNYKSIHRGSILQDGDTAAIADAPWAPSHVERQNARSTDRRVSEIENSCNLATLRMGAEQIGLAERGSHKKLTVRLVGFITLSVAWPSQIVFGERVPHTLGPDRILQKTVT